MDDDITHRLRAAVTDRLKGQFVGRSEVIDLIAAAVIVALRRADEMGDAITARGGAGQISAAPSGPKLRDWVALSIVLAVCGAALAAELTVLGTT